MTIEEFEKRIGRKLEHRAGKSGCGKFKNEMFVGDTCAYIVLYKLGVPISITIIDPDIAQFAKYHTWHQTSHNYSGMASKGDFVYLHRYVMNTHSTLEYIDHINGDKLDNRRINLRFVTQQINMQNRSGVLGISYIEYKKKWRAYITVNRKQKHLGYFLTRDEAIEARKVGEQLHFGAERPSVRPPVRETLV